MVLYARIDMRNKQTSTLVIFASNTAEIKLLILNKMLSYLTENLVFCKLQTIDIVFNIFYRKTLKTFGMPAMFK